MSLRVLVPLDGSALAEQALPHARALAGAEGQLILLEVGEEEDDCTLPQRLPGIPARYECVTGDPAEQILRVVEELHPDLVAMTTRGSGGAEPASVGHVADRLTRLSPVPVLAVQPADGPTPSGIADIRRLVLPLDGSGSAEAAIPTALLLARALRMPIELVAIAEGSAALAPVRERLQDAGLTVSTDIRAGDPLAAIQAASRPGDLLVMSGPGRGGTTPPPLGEVAARVIREGTIPVVLVPAGSSDCGS